MTVFFFPKDDDASFSFRRRRASRSFAMTSAADTSLYLGSVGSSANRCESYSFENRASSTSIGCRCRAAPVPVDLPSSASSSSLSARRAAFPDVFFFAARRSFRVSFRLGAASSSTAPFVTADAGALEYIPFAPPATRSSSIMSSSKSARSFALCGSSSASLDAFFFAFFPASFFSANASSSSSSAASSARPPFFLRLFFLFAPPFFSPISSSLSPPASQSTPSPSPPSRKKGSSNPPPASASSASASSSSSSFEPFFASFFASFFAAAFSSLSRTCFSHTVSVFFRPPRSFFFFMRAPNSSKPAWKVTSMSPFSPIPGFAPPLFP
mmetsp:Transcript_12221/g.43965  ORF Transcript_12221/g.43965 Transcript_12221/m.43965 type:complete len:326 (-) Transcript_12221:105-1082(-)